MARTSANAERTAERVLQDHGITEAPVPVEDVAVGEGITVAHERLDDDDVSGVLYRRGTKAVIVVNKLHPHHRRRFTIAHEIGHYRLHDADAYLDGKATLRFRDGTSAMGTDQEEREANGFAAALLMPATWIRSRFIHLISSPQALNEEKAAEELAREFDVSDQAMRFRLVNLELIDPA